MTMAKEPAGDDPRPVTREPESGDDAHFAPGASDDTHTAALQGAAAGGAASGSAGYASGLMTGSENEIGMREIPDAGDADADVDAASVVPGPPDGATPPPG